MSEYQYFRFKFHKKRYRRLLDRIYDQADGDSENLALRDLIIIWFENERQGHLPQRGQESGGTGIKQPQLGQNQPNDDDLLAALDDLDAAWDE